MINDKNKELNDKSNKLLSLKDQFYSDFAKKEGTGELKKIILDIEKINAEINDKTADLIKYNYERI